MVNPSFIVEKFRVHFPIPEEKWQQYSASAAGCITFSGSRHVFLFTKPIAQ